ncbi:methyltransferase domain-containing protein [Georgenia subflava]|uniref:methyltransferase domain-containing protein n=1 Tax=Georgenia subflava TaxID=1622177 RepID=UPI001D0215DA|nr:methyltransferase domain-containing protein [Georgenia subflava]
MVDALPLSPGLRVLEIGGAPGSAARAVAQRVAPGGYVLVVDRSGVGVQQTLHNGASEVRAGLLGARCSAIEEFMLEPAQDPFDLAFACRVGALDGRYPELFDTALERIRAALRPGGRLFVDTGTPLREVPLGQRDA